MAELEQLLLVACCLPRAACSCRVTGAQQAPAVLAVWTVRLFQGVVFWGVTAALLGPLGWDPEVPALQTAPSPTGQSRRLVVSHDR